MRGRRSEAREPAHLALRGCGYVCRRSGVLRRKGCFGGFFGARILRRCRIASPTRTVPIAIFAASEASEGSVFGLGGLLPVATTVTATTMARGNEPAEQERRTFPTPRLEGSTTDE